MKIKSFLLDYELLAPFEHDYASRKLRRVEDELPLDRRGATLGRRPEVAFQISHSNHYGPDTTKPAQTKCADSFEANTLGAPSTGPDCVAAESMRELPLFPIT